VRDVRRVVASASPLGTLALFAALPALVPSLVDPFTMALSLGSAALAVSLLLRAGLISFGHGLYYAAGAYAVAYAVRGHWTGDAALLALLGAGVAGALAVLVGSFTVRYRGIFFAMLNLAFSMVAYTLLLKLYGLTGGSDGMAVTSSSLLGLPLSPAAFRFGLFYFSVGTVLLSGGVVARYLRCPPGRALEAISSSEVRVEYLGVSARLVLLVAYGLSGLLAGLGGALAALDVGHVAPDLSYWTTSSVFLFSAILGGGGSVPGSFAGALVYELVSLYGARYMATLWNFMLGLVILAIVRFAPRGLEGLYRQAWRRPG
jgi:branched-chain amino acid transport system permease protein